jgi:hypothetical protein
MTCHQGTGVDRPVGAELAEDRPHLLNEQRDQVIRPLAPQRPQGPQKRLARECGLGTERNGSHDIESRSNAAVKDDGGAASDRSAYCGKRVDGGGQAFYLSATMV